MNRSELTAAVAKDTGLTVADAGKALGAVLDNIERALIAGGDVALIGFGTFKVTKRPAKTGRNPRTGASIDIPAANVPKFAPGAKLKAALN